MPDRSKDWESIHALSERILRANSATEELERWCSERNIGDGHIVELCARHAPPEAWRPLLNELAATSQAARTKQADHVQPSPARQANMSIRADHSPIKRTLALARILAFLVAILKPPARAQDEIVTRYQGHSLCDSTVRKLNRFIADRIMRL